MFEDVISHNSEKYDEFAQLFLDYSFNWNGNNRKMNQRNKIWKWVDHRLYRLFKVDTHSFVRSFSYSFINSEKLWLLFTKDLCRRLYILVWSWFIVFSCLPISNSWFWMERPKLIHSYQYRNIPNCIFTRCWQYN